MTGTSKAVLSISVLLLAALVVYYGMAPATTPHVAIDDLPTRLQANEVRMFSRDLEAAAAALGIAPAIVEIAEQPVVIEAVKVVDVVTEVVETEPVIEIEQDQPAKNKLVLYTVVSGDTLGDIAYRLLGSSKYASNIASLNNIDDARTIQLGRTLRIPEMTAQVSKPVRSNPTIPENATAHLIQDGETLSDIASDYLGSPHKWIEIWEANKTRIPNPNRLKVGVAIVIP
jgi:nucleoid-associated protein YgaU